LRTTVSLITFYVPGNTVSIFLLFSCTHGGIYK